MGYLDQVQIKTQKRMHVQKSIIRYLSRFFSGEGTILDMGCGKGEFISQVKGVKLLAIDTDPSAKSHLPSNVTFVNGGVETLSGIESNSVEIIYASNFIEHLSMEEATFFLKEGLRILQLGPKKGFLIIVQPNFRYSYRNYFDDFTHKSVFTHISLSSLLEMTGYEVIVCEKKFLPYSLSSKKAYFSFLLSPYLRLGLRIFGGQMLFVATPKDLKP